MLRTFRRHEKQYGLINNSLKYISFCQTFFKIVKGIFYFSCFTGLLEGNIIDAKTTNIAKALIKENNVDNS